jgi:hypothetical protein
VRVAAAYINVEEEDSFIVLGQIVKAANEIEVALDLSEDLAGANALVYG